MRILAYCLMPNHWHLVLYPRADGDLAKFLQRITLTHTQRYHAQTRTVGYGHIYQGRYKSLPVEVGRPFPGVGSLRGKKRQARRLGQKGGGLAVVERARPPVRKGRAKEAAQPVAGPRAGPIIGSG